MRLSIVVVCAVLVSFPALAAADDARPIYPLASEDTQYVIVLDLADARDAASFDALITATGAADDLGEALARYGIDMRKDIDVVRLAGTQDDVVALVDGRYAAAAKKKVAAGTAKKHRGVPYWIDGEHAAFWVGKRLAIAKAANVTAAIDRWKKKAPSLAKGAGGADVRAAIAMTDTRNDLWIVVAGDALEGMGMPTGTVEAISAAATVETDLAIEVRARSADADKATTLETMLGGFLPQLQDAMSSVGLAKAARTVQLERDDAVLSLRATVPVAELTALATVLSR